MTTIMKNFLISLLAILPLLLLPLDSYADKDKGPSDRAYDRANDNASFKRGDDKNKHKNKNDDDDDDDDHKKKKDKEKHDDDDDDDDDHKDKKNDKKKDK
jgi:hypothetical protein